MNYFEFFDIPVSYQVDLQLLRNRYFENSRKYHPDFFTLDDPVRQTEMLQLAAFNNKAYKVLLDPDQRLKYLLDLHEILTEEGKNEVPHDFLAAMMDYNESLVELEIEPSPDKEKELHDDLVTLQNNLDQSVAHILSSRETMSWSDSDWSVLRDYYLKKRYLRRFGANLRELRQQS